MDCGGQFVMMIGISGMLKWCVDNWGTMEVSFTMNYRNVYCLSVLPLAFIPLMSHPVLTDDSLFYHLDDVECTGNENRLSDCTHGGIGVHNCFERAEEAGVICNSRFSGLF